MEDNGVGRAGWILIAGTLLFPGFLFAYEVDTHMGLTKATVETYTQTVRGGFSQEETAAIVAGGADEDEFPRPLNHFFDPVHQRGLKAGPTWPASKVWAEDTHAQASFCVQNKCLESGYINYSVKFFESSTDYSWDRSVYEYVHGDKIRGLQSLGHILHLLQDSAVPAHVRNDQHLNKWGIGDFDPYEQFAGKFTRENIPSLGIINYPKKSTLSEYFDTLAGFTNAHFVSKDAMFVKYPNPSLNQMDIYGGFVRDPIYKNRVAIVQGEFNRFDSVDNRIISISDSILDPNQSVLSDSWSILSKEAIRNGVGVIDLFFQAVEKEKQTKELKKKNVSQKDTDVKNFKLKVFSISKDLYGSSLSTEDVSDLLDSQSNSAPTQTIPPVTNTSRRSVAEKPPVSAEPKPQQPGIVAGVSTSTVISDEIVVDVATTSPAGEDLIVPITEIIPASVVGGGGYTSSSNTPAPIVTVATPTITTPLASALLATTSISVEGTAEANTSITLSATLAGGSTTTATTTSSSGGLWSIALSVLEGTTTISVSAADSSGNMSSTTTRLFSSDVTAPSVSVLSLLECNNSLVTGGACAGSGQATLSLSAPSSDVSYYHYIVDGAVAGTATTLGSTALTSGSHTVAVAAYDSAGNGATSTTVSITSLNLSLVINEVGWMGTKASASDHWVELYNRSSNTIDLTKVRLATDTWSTSALTGTLGSGEMYLIEKSQTASSVTANFTDGNLAFTSSPIQLRLEYTAGGYATTTIDATPIASACGSLWCAGTDNADRRSMERTRTDIAGTTSTNWNSNNMFATYGLDSGSVKIMGSLMEPNSMGQHNLVQYTCEAPYTTFYTEGGFHVPGSSNCRYYSPTILGSFHYATAYAGTVGSSTQYGGHSTGSVTDTVQSGDVIPVGYNVQGQDLFVAVFTIPSGELGTAYLNLFTTYFKTGANAPPMGNYGVFRFKYGSESP